MDEQWLAAFGAALLSVVNPVGNAGIFATMVESRSNSESRRVARTCAIAVLVIMLVSTWFGGEVLRWTGVDVPELLSAGGVIVLIIGLRMLFNDKSHAQTKEEAKEASDRESIAIVPLAIPIVGGPGTIALIVATAQQHPTFSDRTWISAVCFLVAIIVVVVFSLAKRIAEVLGTNGMAVVTRLMGMLLACIAMGMLAAGLRGLLPEWFV